MENYQKIAQWASTLKAEKALRELKALKLKYPWLRCDESLAFLEQMERDLPKISLIVKHQEKQNLIHRKFIEVSQIADKAIVESIQTLYKL